MILTGHPLIEGLPLSELIHMLEQNSSLHGYLQGYLAEIHLRKILLEIPEVTSVTKIPDRAPEKGDLEIVYKDVTLTIEVKSVGSKSYREDVLHGGWSGSVVCKGTDKKVTIYEGREVNSTHLLKGQFDGLAACTFNATGTWDFFYIDFQSLPEPDGLKGFIKTQFRINPHTDPLTFQDPALFLESLYKLKSAHDDRHSDHQRLDKLLQGQRARYEFFDGEPHL